MSFIFILKCIIIFSSHIYSKNLIEFTDTSSVSSSSFGPAPSSTTGGSDQGLATRKGAKSGSSSNTELKLFKVGSDSNPVLMEDKEYLYDDFMGTRTYAFKPEVPCVLIRFNNMDVWKKGDHSVEKPKSVTFDGVSKEITVRDKETAAFFKKDEQTGQWKHVVNMLRKRRPELKTNDSTDANQASSVPANEAKEAGEDGSTDANQAETGSGEDHEQSKDASAEAGSDGTDADSDTSAGSSPEAAPAKSSDSSAGTDATSIVSSGEKATAPKFSGEATTPQDQSATATTPPTGVTDNQSEGKASVHTTKTSDLVKSGSSTSLNGTSTSDGNTPANLSAGGGAASVITSTTVSSQPPSSSATKQASSSSGLEDWSDKIKAWWSNLSCSGFTCGSSKPDGSGTTGGGGNTFEIDVNASNEPNDNKKFKRGGNCSVDFYRIKKNQKCSKVKFGDKVLWTHDGGQNPYPEKVIYRKSDKEIEIDFSVDVKTYKQDGEEWKEETKGSETGDDH